MKIKMKIRTTNYKNYDSFERMGQVGKRNKNLIIKFLKLFNIFLFGGGTFEIKSFYFN